MLNDARVASLGFFTEIVCTTRIKKEKKSLSPPKLCPNSAGLYDVLIGKKPFGAKGQERKSQPSTPKRKQ